MVENAAAGAGAVLPGPWLMLTELIHIHLASHASYLPVNSYSPCIPLSMPASTVKSLPEINNPSREEPPPPLILFIKLACFQSFVNVMYSTLTLLLPPLWFSFAFLFISLNVFRLLG